MTDLETELRAALAARAEEIHADDLRGAATRHRRAFWPALAAAAVVAALAVGSTVLLTRDRSDAPAANGTAGLSEYSWRLISVTTSRGTFPAPAPAGRPRPGLSFPGDSAVTGDDTVNFASGHYRTTAHGFRVPDATTTAVAYAGTDQRVLATIDGIGAVMGGAEVTVRLSGDSLVLTAKGDTLRLQRAGRISGATPSTSSTPPATALTPVVGIDWWLVSVTTGGHTYAAPAAPREQPRFTLYPDGTLFADDSVNSYDGHYRATADGYVVVGSLQVGGAGALDDPTLVRFATGRVTGPAPVTARVDGDTLVLSVGGVRATYRNHGTAKPR